MGDAEYIEAVKGHLEKFGSLLEKRAQLDAEIEKLRQLIRATLHMLSNKEEEAFRKIFESMRAPQPGLTETIGGILEKATDWMTAVEVRDELVESGFSFDAYTSNPLASVHTILKRFVPERVEMRPRGTTGSAEYRWTERKFMFPSEREKKRGKPPFGTRGKKQG